MTRRAVFVSPAPQRITPAKLRDELVAEGVPLFPATTLEPLDCYFSGGQFAVIINASTDQWDSTVQAVVAAHVPDSLLPALKAKRLAQVDARTQQLILQGFSWNGATLSLSATAQMNWTNLFISRKVMSYPLEVSTLDSNSYSIASAVEMANLYYAGLAHTKAIIDGGRALKILINACTTEVELDAILDTR